MHIIAWNTASNKLNISWTAYKLTQSCEYFFHSVKVFVQFACPEWKRFDMQDFQFSTGLKWFIVRCLSVMKGWLLTFVMQKMSILIAIDKISAFEWKWRKRGNLMTKNENHFPTAQLICFFLRQISWKSVNWAAENVVYWYIS